MDYYVVVDFHCYIMIMDRTNKLLMIFLALAFAALACNLPGRSQTQNIPEPPPVEAPPLAEPVPPVAAENCVSPMEPGIWAGSVNLTSTASRMGFQVLEQRAVLPMNLLINCDGTISGTAARSGQASINVPLTVNGVCTDSVQYDVRGLVGGEPQNPTLNLSLTAREGSMSCDINSRVQSIPGGEQQANLAGQEEDVQITAAAASVNRVEGADWPDRFYQEQLPDLDRLMVEYELDVESGATWALERQ